MLPERNSMKPILISGSLAYDKILDYAGRFSDHLVPDKIHTLSVSFVVEDLSEHFGGTAGNIAYSLALLAERPVVLSAAGKDFGPYRERLISMGVNVQHVREIPDTPTMQATIMTDLGDNQIAGVYLGTMAYPCEIDASDIPADALAVVAPGNLDDMCRLAELYRQKNIPFFFDPGQQIPQLSADQARTCIAGAFALISNDYELGMISAKTGWSENDILKKSNRIITTFGEKGSRIRTASAVIDIPSAKVGNVIDPTGAGDAYRAGLVKGIMAGWPLEVSCKFAGVIAAYAIEARGPQGHTFTFADARKRYRQNFDSELPYVHD